MKVLAVDDEWIMLEELMTAILASPDVEIVKGFLDCQEALAYVEKEEVDIAFLDIHMRTMTGLELAQKIMEQQPYCKVVFCTGFDEYALDAFKIHATGYLMKPVTADAVQKELNHIKGYQPKKQFLEAKCFGTFEIFADEKPLLFKRSKTKELLAYLIDRNGAGVTAKQICAVLWEEKLDDDKNLNYFWQLLSDLRTTLKALGLESLLVKSGSCYSIDKNLVKCDYYSFCECRKPEFSGEYMSQYSWSEDTCASLERMISNG